MNPDASTEPEKAAQVPAGLRALLTHIVDYAGLFPPAKLDMQPTARNYAQYLTSDESWMLARLIIPAARLDEFEQHADALLPRDGGAEPWLISCLTAPAGDEKLAGDLDRIWRFNDQHGADAQGRAMIDVIELRAASASDVDAALDRIPDVLFAFFEIPADDDPRGTIAALVGSDGGAKVRTGGVTADAFPQPADLARFIKACADSNVPFKATAGLHHPVTAHHESVKTTMYGFLNVFLAGCFARDGADADVLVELLTDESTEVFSFSEAGAVWRDRTVSRKVIEEARGQTTISFGSCSFDEPRDDLRALQLLTR